MAILATYVSSTSFTLDDEVDAYFPVGTKIQTNQGVDGSPVVSTVSATYNAGTDKTTIVTNEAVLTANLVSIKIGVGDALSIGLHYHTSNSDGGNLVNPFVIFPGDTQRIFQSALPQAGNFLCISDTAYFVYMGKTSQAITPKYVEAYVQTQGSSTQTAEVGLFSSPAAPNKAGQSLSKLVATGSCSTLTGGSVMFRNSAAFTTSIPKDTHLWAGIRTAMAGTQPTFYGLLFDMSQGQVLSTATAGVLTAAGPWTGALISLSANCLCPALRVTMD